MTKARSTREDGRVPPLSVALLARGLALAAFSVVTIIVIILVSGSRLPAQSGLSDAAAFALFAPIADVLEHPRCMNCHPRSDRPLQTDARMIHQMNVVRGEAGMGAAGLPCTACHGSANNQVSMVPGAPLWHLAPLSMGWQGLSRGELCRALIDPSRNGNRTVEDLVEHMTVDPLVLWGWDPGGDRSPIPVPHGDFVLQLQAWAASGGPCPE